MLQFFSSPHWFIYLVNFHKNSFWIFFIAEDDIASYCLYFRNEFPTETCPPKFHMLEEHIIPFIRKWKFGLGFLGEQGGEGVHAKLNVIRQDMRGFNDDLAILKAVIESHWVQTSPLCTSPPGEEWSWSGRHHHASMAREEIKYNK